MTDTAPRNFTINFGPQHPAAHGVLSIADRVSPRAALLSELLAAAGYDTAAFVTNTNVSGPFGFKPGEMEQALVMSLVEIAPTAVPK